MKVSIVTPSYNQARFIGRTLQSVASQNSPDFEIEHVVFDGGSTDDTVEVLKHFGGSVRWVSKPDKGQAHAVNQGICSTNGEIIGWLNSDDIYYPDTIARVITFFAANPHVDVVYGGGDHINVDDHAFERYPSEPWDFQRLKENCFICQPAVFFRRNVVEKHGLLDESLNYCMDYEYWLRIGHAGVQMAYMDEVLAGSRLYSENKTLGARVMVHREINDMLKNKFRKVPDRWIFNYAHAFVEEKMSQKNGRKVFAMKVGLVAVISSLYWNKRVSVSMLSEVKKWAFC